MNTKYDVFFLLSCWFNLQYEKGYKKLGYFLQSDFLYCFLLDENDSKNVIFIF
jgi:hypothetical protein